jgi:YihY family inner membrane protein
MSTANVVPETWELTGDDAQRLLRQVGRRRLARDAFMRMRFSDGFSHARSLAFLMSLVVVQGLVALVGFAEAFGGRGFGQLVARFTRTAAGGGAADTIVATVENAQQTGAAHRYLPLVLGLVGAIVSGTTAMAQLERALNRMYGIEQDRPFFEKYGRALLLALTAGTLVAASVVATAMGRSIGDSLDSSAVSTAWDVVRFPIALVILAAAMALLFRWCPRRRQPAWTWLAYGSTVSVIGLFLVTMGLTVALRLSSTFGDTYGPLAGTVALLLWALLSAIALLFGASFAAQLEAVRAGATPPQDHAKVDQSEPEMVTAGARS